MKRRDAVDSEQEEKLPQVKTNALASSTKLPSKLLTYIWNPTLLVNQVFLHVNLGVRRSVSGLFSSSVNLWPMSAIAHAFTSHGFAKLIK